jgi:hypothetical protein
MAGADLDSGIAGQIADGPGIRLGGREWPLDIHVGAIAERDPGQREMSGWRCQQVDDRWLRLSKHGVRVAVATRDGMTRRGLTCSPFVRIAHSHDLNLRQGLECCDVVSADPAAPDEGDANVGLVCAHGIAARHATLE